ncbi:MAG TPA: ABC transporter permease [Longimicrobium sp.]
MEIREAVVIALAMIRANKLRAFFTVLGTVVGVTFLIAVITVLKGMDAYMKEDFAGKMFGFNTVTVRRIPQEEGFNDDTRRRAWLRRPRLQVADAEWLRERVRTPGMLAYNSSGVAPVGNARGKSVKNAWIVGSSASFFRIRDFEVADGRPFSEQEADRGTPVVVLGHDVVQRLFPGVNPVGKTVRLAGFPYRVIGVLEKQGTVFGQSVDNFVVAPFRSPINGSIYRHNVAEEISFKVPNQTLVPVAMNEMEGLMRIRHRLRPGVESDFAVETSESVLGFWNKISSFLIIALPFLVGVSLVVGAVVIMNIMLVSVSERTREIGVRKSLGARRRDILMQFIIEAGTLSGAGGVIGILLGLGLAALVTAVSPLPARVSPASIGLGLALGVGVGLAAGVYPAWRAARLDPIVALRSE